MAHSISLVALLPAATFKDPGSQTVFKTYSLTSGTWQTLTRPDETQTVQLSYAIGSGAHAFGFLAQIGNHLFQSPVSYYTQRRSWDLAPGYEGTAHPDFSRPVTLECLTCHSDQPRPVAGSLNTYLTPPLAGLGIQCDRCHGDPSLHLKSPVPGSIVNPAKLPPAARDSVCEQCHLAGEVRIPNPGKNISDFHPGEPLESVYTVYILRRSPQDSIKVISQAEELARSACARNSGGRLWCGTCHNPHQTPVQPAAYFRERCLSCHGATLDKAHAAPGSDCIACHMPRRPARDGGHTAFTDHRISLPHDIPTTTPGSDASEPLVAWRDPAPSLRDRNLALALVSAGLQNSNAGQVIRGFRMLVRLEPALSNDAPALTALGTVLLKGKQPAEAASRFASALALRPNYPPYEVNLAVALAGSGNPGAAVRHLERALQLDPLLQQAVQLLAALYRAQGESQKADALLSGYRTAMGITLTSSPPRQ